MNIQFLVLGILLIIISVPFMLFGLTRIEGTSMFPTLKEDDVLLLRRVFPWETPKIDEVYVFFRNGYRFVKRLKHYNESTVDSKHYYFCYFIGDNSAHSYDSRNFGRVKWTEVKYKAVYNFNGRSLNG